MRLSPSPSPSLSREQRPSKVSGYARAWINNIHLSKLPYSNQSSPVIRRSRTATQPEIVAAVLLVLTRTRLHVAVQQLSAVLPPPDVSLVRCVDGLAQELRIVVQRGVHYWYTIDGTDPSFSNGKLHTGKPVKVSAELQPSEVKAIALPAAVLPSTIAVAMKAP